MLKVKVGVWIMASSAAVLFELYATPVLLHHPGLCRQVIGALDCASFSPTPWRTSSCPRSRSSEGRYRVVLHSSAERQLLSCVHFQVQPPCIPCLPKSVLLPAVSSQRLDAKRCLCGAAHCGAVTFPRPQRDLRMLQRWTRVTRAVALLHLLPVAIGITEDASPPQVF